MRGLQPAQPLRRSDQADAAASHLARQLAHVQPQRRPSRAARTLGRRAQGVLQAPAGVQCVSEQSNGAMSKPKRAQAGQRERGQFCQRVASRGRRRGLPKPKGGGPAGRAQQEHSRRQHLGSVCQVSQVHLSVLQWSRELHSPRMNSGAFSLPGHLLSQHISIRRLRLCPEVLRASHHAPEISGQVGHRRHVEEVTEQCPARERQDARNMAEVQCPARTDSVSHR